LAITTIKGFKDILPREIETWQRIEMEARKVFRVFGFKEIKPPLMEKTELFKRGIGEDTDIVSKEMYTLMDSKGRGQTLRPEATASVVRSYIQNKLYNDNPVQKLFTIGPMFRHERPQKGRFRQFHQINAELFGDPGPSSDADLIIMAMHLFESVGMSELTLNINSLGCQDCRPQFREGLKSFLGQYSDELCSDCQRRAETNPLRVFDCKVKGCGEVVVNAPSVLDSLCNRCQDHFNTLMDYLTGSDISFTVNPMLVRGLDYYTRTAFEIQTDRLGAQNAVAGGGRYDGLVRQLYGPDHPSIGFAIGIERLVALLEEQNNFKTDSPDLFIAGLGDTASKKVFFWVHELRKNGLFVEMEYELKGLKAQMKRADKLGAKRVLIIGDDELASGKGIIRDMVTKEQGDIFLDSLVENLISE